jgi:hypothetical protein
MTPESRDYGARKNCPLLVTAHQPVKTRVRKLRNYIVEIHYQATAGEDRKISVYFSEK